jgi:two-component system LytT family response regulator
MLRAMLIDDEPESIQVISTLIDMFCPHVQIAGAFTDPFLGLEALKPGTTDVLLLDIEMPGMTGLELLRRLPSIDFEVIFITAYNQYALNAIKLSALDYLLKPVDPAELETALQKAEEKQKSKKTLEQISVLVNLLNRSQDKKQVQQNRIALPTFEGVTYISMHDIVRIDAEQNYCRFFLQDGRQLVISKNIGHYEESLEEHFFMRVHRSHIINLLSVTDFVRLDGGFVRMTDGSKVEISGQRKEELLKRLGGL